MMNNLLNSLLTFFIRIFYSPTFILKINKGEISKEFGSVKYNFIADCSEIVARNKINYGVIYAKKNEYKATTIYTTFNINKIVLQQIRNVFQFR